MDVAPPTSPPPQTSSCTLPLPHFRVSTVVLLCMQPHLWAQLVRLQPVLVMRGLTTTPLLKQWWTRAWVFPPLNLAEPADQWAVIAFPLGLLRISTTWSWRCRTMSPNQCLSSARQLCLLHNCTRTVHPAHSCRSPSSLRSRTHQTVTWVQCRGAHHYPCHPPSKQLRCVHSPHTALPRSSVNFHVVCSTQPSLEEVFDETAEFLGDLFAGLNGPEFDVAAFQ